MTTTLDLEGPATIGDAAVWSVTESATQASPAEPVRATPAFSYSGPRTNKTKFAIHQAATLNHDKLGSISGFVRSIQPSGIGATLECQTVLNQLNVEAEFNATLFPTGLLSGYIEALVTPLLTEQGSAPEARMAVLAGGIPSSWAPADGGPNYAPIGIWALDDIFLTSTYSEGSFFSRDSATWAPVADLNADGNTWLSAAGVVGNYAFVGYTPEGAGRAGHSADGENWTISTVPLSSVNSVAYGAGRFVAVGLPSTTTPDSVATSVDGEVWTAITDLPFRASIVTHDGGRFIALGENDEARVSATSADGISWTVYPQTESIYASWMVSGNGVTITQSFGGSFMTTDGANWSPVEYGGISPESLSFGDGQFIGIGTVNSPEYARIIYSSADGNVWETTATPDLPIEFVAIASVAGVYAAASYESGFFRDAPEPPSQLLEWRATTDPIVTYVPWRGNIWQMLNGLLAFHKVEMVFISGQIVIRDIGSVVVDIDNATVRPKTSTAVNARLSVDVTYREAERHEGVVYDAYVDGNKIYSVDVNEYREDEIIWEVTHKRYNLETHQQDVIGTTTNAPTFLDQPIEAPYKTTRPAPGYYVLSAQDGLPLAPGQFADYGGKLEVALNPENPFSFILRWNGPTTEIPGAPGPYSLKVGDYGAFSVTGEAIYSTDKKVNVRTGASPSVVTDATPYPVNLPWVNSFEDAIRVGAAAGHDLSSTVEEITFSVATGYMTEFGFTVGAIFRWDNALWRITTSNIQNASVAITARYHTRFSDFDAEMSAAGKTYADFDEIWATHKYKDVRIEPLRTEA